MYIEREHYRVDKEIEYKEAIDRIKHGDRYGLRRIYYHCDRCNVGWSGYVPFHLIHFKHGGLNYGVPRPIKGLTPQCPNCRSNDNVNKINRYKKKE